MERRQRIVFAAVAALIAVVAVVVLAGGPDERTERADAPPATGTATGTPEPQEAGPQATATPTATRRPKPALETVRFRDGEVAGGLARLRFDKGETVRFAVASDTADEVHVHGYDVTKAVEAGGTVRFSFPADIEGIFEVELENAGAQLAQLRVDP